MADEAQETAVKDEVASTESAPVDAPDNSTQPPAGEKPVVDSQGNRVPYERFHDVVEERNQERQRRESAEAQIRELMGRQVTPQKSLVDVEAERLASELQLKPEFAKKLAESNQRMARAEREQIETRLRQQDVSRWFTNKSKEDKDFSEIAPEMEKQFSSLPPDEQAFIKQSTRGLDMFYSHVKGLKASDLAKKQFENGAKQAYETKVAKAAVSSVPGSSASKPASKLTRESITKMPEKEWIARQSEITEALAKGLID